MEEDVLEDAADPNGQDEDELGLGSDGEMEEDEEDEQEKQDSYNQHELKDEDANKSNNHEDGKEKSGEEEVKKNIVQNEREKHEGENGDDGKMVPHEEGQDLDLDFPDSQPILGETPAPQVWDGDEEKDGEIIPATPPAAQPDIAATPPATQPDPVIEIEDTPEKSWEPIQTQSVQKLMDRRQAINENISELTEKLNHAKKLIASKCFGLN